MFLNVSNRCSFRNDWNVDNGIFGTEPLKDMSLAKLAAKFAKPL